MKRLILFFLTLAFCSFSLAQQVTSQSKENAVASTLLCTRSIIEKRLNGRDGIQLASSYLSGLESNINNTLALTQIAADCSTALPKMRKAAVSRDMQYEDIQKSNFSSRVKDTLKSFVRPHLTCKEGGIDAHIGFLLGFSAKVDGAFCKASNGRGWLQVSPGIGIGFFSGLEAHAAGGTRDRDQNYYASPILASDSDDEAAAAVYSFSEERKHNDKNQIDAKGMGIGLGGGQTHVGQLDIKIVPLGTDVPFLVKSFLDHQ